MHADVEPRGVHADGLVGVRPEQLRLEWGSEDSPDYAGWLQVHHAEPGHSSVMMHLSFLGNQPETRGHGNAADEVRAWLDDALGRLEPSSPAPPEARAPQQLAGHPSAPHSPVASVTLGCAPERGTRDG